MKKLNYIFIVGMISLFAGCGSEDQVEIHEIDPVKVTVKSVNVINQMPTVTASGRIEAANSANISTRMMGNITDVLVQPGDRVKRGDLLLTISSADLQAKQAQVRASVSQAKSAYENAAKDYDRFKILHEKGSASKKELENITTRFDVAKAGLAAAREMENEVQAQLAYTNLRSPFDGVVANTFVKSGDLANPGMPLMTVEGTSDYEAAVMVPESQISKIQAGADADILIKSSNRKLKGKVKEVSPSGKNTGGQFLVKITLNETENMMPGMFIQAQIHSISTTREAGSPLVLKDALIHQGQLTGIYTFSTDSKAVLRWIRIGESVGDEVEVLSGISEGEQYILQAEGKLFNGAKVSIN
jgi:RND family efflux transporter MFP subunit